MRKENGWVEITYHQSKYMYQPLVEKLLCNKKEGTTCILTQTNEEAVILTALLRKNGINSKLIQSLDGFRFWNLAEIRYFTGKTHLRFEPNALAFQLKRQRVLDKTHLRFTLNASAFSFQLASRRPSRKYIHKKGLPKGNFEKALYRSEEKSYSSL